MPTLNTKKLRDILTYQTPIGYSVWVREDDGDWSFVKDGFKYGDQATRWARRKVGYRVFQVRNPVQSGDNR